MIFNSIELKGYRRFALNNIKLFKMDITEAIQIILGRNGCGKSSLISEMHPGPADKNAFDKDGHKIFTCFHNGNSYKITSTFSPNVRHSFIKNDIEELNEGGTATIQKELCKTELGFDLQFLPVIYGLENFTDMTPARRRELFTLMCSADYSYAIKVYNNINSQKRDNEGALKTAKKRLTSEITSDMLDKEYDELREQLNDLTIRSQELYQKKIPDLIDQKVCEESIVKIIKAIDDLSKTFWSSRHSIIKNQIWSPHEINEENENLKEDLKKQELLLNVWSEQYDEIQEKIKNLSGIDEEDLKDFKDKIVILSKENEMLLNGLKTDCVPSNIDHAVIALNMVKEPLKSVLVELPINEDNWYNYDSYTKNKDNLAQYQAQINHLDRSISNTKSNLELFEKASKNDDTQCPSCNHVFKAGYNQNEHVCLKESLDRLSDLLDINQTSANELSEIVKDQSDYFSKIDTIKSIVSSAPQLKVLWDKIIVADIIRNNPSLAISIIDRFDSDLQNLIVIQKNKEQIIEISKKINSVSEESQRDIMSLKKGLVAVENKIDMATLSISTLKKKIDKNNEFIKQVIQVQSIGDKMRYLKDKLNDGIVIRSKIIVNSIIDQALQETHKEIARISSRISSMQSRKTLISDIKNQISQYEQNEKTYALILKALSPTDGLIAEGLLGFIKKFVMSMNKVISKHWTYGITVKDCSLDAESADLNYKFPVIVEGDPTPREDVKQGSTGMREVINLAFRIIAMHNLGLNNYPLFIDEFGSSFDTEHKARAPQAIKHIYETMSFSQVFIISHHQMDYGVFPNAQFCVIDPNNICIDNITYNKHVEIS